MIARGCGSDAVEMPLLTRIRTVGAKAISFRFLVKQPSVSMVRRTGVLSSRFDSLTPLDYFCGEQLRPRKGLAVGCLGSNPSTV